MQPARDPETEPDPETELERRRQVRGLVYLAISALAFALVRAIWHSGVHSVFPHGWWRIR
jgi:hypothetical protein